MMDSFKFKKNWYEAMARMPADIKIKVFDAVCEYAFKGKIESEMDELSNVAIGFIIPELEEQIERVKLTSSRKSEAAKKVRANATIATVATVATNATTKEKVSSSPSPTTPTTTLSNNKNIYKESSTKKVKFADHVSMTVEEHKKLIDAYGEEQTKWMIDKLSNYKGANGKTYKSDYLAILNWVVADYEKNKKANSNVSKDNPRFHPAGIEKPADYYGKSTI